MTGTVSGEPRVSCGVPFGKEARASITVGQ